MVYVAMADYPKALADLNEAVRIPDPSPVKLLHLALRKIWPAIIPKLETPSSGPRN